MQEHHKSADYAVLYYKQNGSIGIRRKKPRDGETHGKQIFTFGAGSGLAEHALRTWASRVLKKLDDGEEEEHVKGWIQGEMKKLS